MLELAKKRKIYKRHMCEYLGPKKLDINDGMYTEIEVTHGCVSYTPLPSPGLHMQLQVGLISCAAVIRGKKPLPLLVKYIESR